jgi:hypothetical protein
MIELKMPDMSDWTDDQADAWYNSGNRGSFGTRNSNDAIDTFDDLLKPFGLQVGYYSGSSDHEVAIVPLEGGPNEDAAVKELNRMLADALSATEAAEKTQMAMKRKLVASLDRLRQRLDTVSPDDVLARTILLAQIDYAKILKGEIERIR